jgi:hypothetical protein
MDKTQQNAVDRLERLLKTGGELFIITGEVHPDHRQDKADPRSPAKEGVNLALHSAYVVHEVVRLEGPDARGRMVAYSAEGDWTAGMPEALLDRLRETTR